MKKGWFLVGVIFLLVPWVLVGCGIPQEQYDATVAELDKAQQELQSVKAELGTTQAKVAELTSDLSKTQTELEAAQDEVSGLATSLEKNEAELETTQTEKSELNTSLEKSRTELEAVQSEYESFESDIKSTWDRLDKILGLQWLLVRYWSEAAKGNTEAVEQYTAKMVSYVEPIGDSMMDSLWEQAMSAAEKGQDNLFLESFAALMDRNSALLKADAKAIRDALAK